MKAAPKKYHLIFLSPSDITALNFDLCRNIQYLFFSIKKVISLEINHRGCVTMFTKEVNLIYLKTQVFPFSELAVEFSKKFGYAVW